MTSTERHVTARMQALIQEWEAASDQRALFLRCYLMMTDNVLAAIEQDVFRDSAWVNRLLHLFAHYYFVALDAYSRDPQAAPPVWKLAFDKSVDPDTLVLQKLLLGINAHINYDLVLTLHQLLRPEWGDLSESQRADRYADNNMVNEIIGSTVDAVQDQIIEPAMPVMEWIDRLLGPLDEKLVSILIADWREKVWENAVRLLETPDPDESSKIISQVEQDALQIGHILGV